MAAGAAGRTLSPGWAAVPEWTVKQGRPDGLDVVVDQVDDASVRAQAIRHIQQYKPPPSGLRPEIEPYADDPDSEVRRQVKLTLAELPE